MLSSTHIKPNQSILDKNRKKRKKFEKKFSELTTENHLLLFLMPGLG